MRGMSGPGGVVHEEGLVRHQGLLLADPIDGVVCHVLGEVVALLRSAIGLDRHGVLIDSGGVLVGLPADEPVEVLEAVSRARPTVEGAHRAGLPDRDLVAFAEVGSGIAVELQYLGNRGLVPRSHRVIAGSGCCDLGDPAHSHRMVVATAEESGPGRGTQCGGVEPGVLQAILGKALEVRGIAGPTEGRARSEPDIVEEDDEDVWRTIWGPHRFDRRESGIRILGVVSGDADPMRVGDGEILSAEVLGISHIAEPTRGPQGEILTLWG